MNRASLGRAALGGVAGALLLSVLGSTAAARADVIVLRGGGQVEGKMVPVPAAAADSKSSKAKKDDRVEVLLLKSRAPLMLRREQILDIIPKASPLDEYVVKREAAPATGQAQFELGEWCETKGLDELARVHFQAAVKLDGTLVAAHQKLGHVEHDGQWLSRDALRKVQGLTLYKGRWVTEEEKAREEEEAVTTAGQASWVRRINLLVQAVREGAPDRRREAETQLMQIRDPEAVWPLVKVMGNAETDLRILLAQTLGEIPGKESARALVRMVLAEVEDHVRSVVLDRLRKNDDPVIPSQLMRALGADDLRVVNRAAWALGNLGVVEAVPRLLKVLVTTEQRMVMAPPATSGGLGMGGGYPPILMGFNGSAASYLTPPVVGPGVVAYGATAVPYVYGLFPDGSPIRPYIPPGVPGGGGVALQRGPDRGPMPQIVTYTHQNAEVLGALINLTEQDFGYDVDLWRRWVTRAFNPRPNPVRKVPQP